MQWSDAIEVHCVVLYSVFLLCSIMVVVLHSALHYYGDDNRERGYSVKSMFFTLTPPFFFFVELKKGLIRDLKP